MVVWVGGWMDGVSLDLRIACNDKIFICFKCQNLKIHMKILSSQRNHKYVHKKGHTGFNTFETLGVRKLSS